MAESKRSSEDENNLDKTQNLRGAGKNLPQTEIITPKPKQVSNLESADTEVDPEIQTLLDDIEAKTSIVIDQVFSESDKKALEQADTAVDISSDSTRIGLSQNQAKMLDEMALKKDQLNNENNLKLEVAEKEVMEYQRHRVEYMHKEMQEKFLNFREGLKTVFKDYKKYSLRKEKRNEGFDTNFDKLMFFLLKSLEESKEFDGPNIDVILTEKAFQAYKNFTPEHNREQKYIRDGFKEIAKDRELVALLFRISDRFQDLKEVKHLFTELGNIIEMTEQGMIGNSDLHKKYFESFKRTPSLEISNFEQQNSSKEEAA